MDERWFLIIGLFFLVVIYVDSTTCGNAVLEEGEVCDTNKLNKQNCTNFNYTGGDLGCLNDCSGYDFNQCTGEEVCGNEVIGGSELCEPGNVRGRTCEDEGYEGGTLKCKYGCVKYDYSECTGNRSICGDGEVTGNEECDGDNLNGESCESLGFLEGRLSCVDCIFNTSLCIEEEIEDINESVGVNETEENISRIGEVPSGVVGVAGYESKKGLSLSSWLLIISGILVVGVVVIYIYIFKIKK